MPPDIPPMLAGRGIPEGCLDGWAAEPKLDGWRVRVAVDGMRLVVKSRPGRIITPAVPDLVPLISEGLRVVLDGELVCGAGRMVDFYRLSGLLASDRLINGERLRFMAFDLLWQDGEEIVDRPYTERRERLEGLTLPGSSLGIIPRYRGSDAMHLLKACEDEGLEGVVLKRLQSPYRAGQRSNDWRKAKCAGWTEHLERRRLAHIDGREVRRRNRTDGKLGV